MRNIVIILFLIAPFFVGAQDGYVELVGVPNLPDPGNASLGEYVNALYWLSIGIAAVLAVLKLILAGAKYILSDVITSKESAKKDIQWSIVGLLIVLSAVVVLNTINPQLTELDALSNLCDTNNPNDPGCIDSDLPSQIITTPIDSICAQPGGCTRLACSNIATWGPTTAGSGLGSQTSDCQQRCDYIGGTIQRLGIGIARECVVGTNSLASTSQSIADAFAAAAPILQDTCLAAGGRYTGSGDCSMTPDQCAAVGNTIFDASTIDQAFGDDYGLCRIKQ